MRLGDAFESGVIVTTPGITSSTQVRVSVTLAGGSGLTLRGAATKTVQLQPDDTQAEVSWGSEQLTHLGHKRYARSSMPAVFATSC